MSGTRDVHEAGVIVREVLERGDVSERRCQGEEMSG